MRSMITIAILLFGYGFSNGQTFNAKIQYVTQIDAAEANNWVFYQPDRKLSIRDFKMEPDNDQAAIAITMSGFAFKAKFRNMDGVSTLLVNVYCNFDTNKSWMKSQAKNAIVLNHEQKHFDLTYLYCLKFIHQLRLLNFTAENYRQLLIDTHKSCVNELDSTQKMYDNETGNGVILSEQKKWNENISQWIKLEQKN